MLAARASHKDRQELERKLAANASLESCLVFTTTVGTPLDARNLVRKFKRHLRAAGLPDEMRFFDLGHAAMSLLIADGLPITVVSALLGHAVTSTTVNNYAHGLPGVERLLGQGVSAKAHTDQSDGRRPRRRSLS